LNDIIYFRQAHLAMETDYPFSASFGIASTRRTCVNSAIRLYNKLLKLQNDGDVLRFATIAEVAMLNAKSADSQKMRHMLQVFRPDKDEVVTLVDFAGAVDNVYKKLTLLKRSIENAAAIDRAYEHMINAGFFTVVFVIVLAALGIDPLAFILALSSLIVSFAFMIGSAASNYFEGILLILLRRPYEIGDRIAVSAVDDPAETDGSAGWIVENIDLYTTTVRLAATREVATVSNGSLARSRIINMKRSEKALLTIFLRFSVDTPFEKIVILKNAVEVYVKERPQEWISLAGFRSAVIQSDLGYIQYNVILQHQASWQNIVAVLESKAHLSSFCLEVQKQLGIRYIAPPMPVNLSFRTGSAGDPGAILPPVAPPLDASSSVAVAPDEDRNQGTKVKQESPGALGKHIAALMQSFETKKEK